MEPIKKSFERFKCKLLRIRAEVGKIEKRGVDDVTAKPYTRLEDILDAVNPLLDKHGLLFTGELAPDAIPAIHQLAKGCVRDVVMNFVLEDTKLGHSRSWRIPGSGWDGEYDGSGIAKAIAAARKAAYVLVFALRTVEPELQEEPRIGTQEAADAVGEKKAEALRKRRETVAAKEFVRVTWPEAHNGHRALFVGRIHIMEHKAFSKMSEIGKFVEREDGWLVDSPSVNSTIEYLKSCGCEVVTSE